MEPPIRFFDPMADTRKSGGILPHWEQPGVCYFITFRLADSLPSELTFKWKHDRDAWLEKHPKPWDEETEQEYHRVFSLKIEKWLDQGRGECLLKDEAARQIALGKITESHETSLFIHSLVIMPNHIHVLVTVETGSLSEIMRKWKGATSFLINRQLGRRGSLWQRDYFDRIVRDARHFERCKRYIASNPEKSGLRNGGFTVWGA